MDPRPACRRVADFFVVPLVATLFLAIFLLFPVEVWLQQWIPSAPMRIWMILLIFFTLIYVTERIVLLVLSSRSIHKD